MKPRRAAIYARVYRMVRRWPIDLRGFDGARAFFRYVPFLTPLRRSVPPMIAGDAHRAPLPSPRRGAPLGALIHPAYPPAARAACRAPEAQLGILFHSTVSIIIVHRPSPLRKVGSMLACCFSGVRLSEVGIERFRKP